jgi:hypothetical protein
MHCMAARSQLPAELSRAELAATSDQPAVGIFQLAGMLGCWNEGL